MIRKRRVLLAAAVCLVTACSIERQENPLISPSVTESQFPDREVFPLSDEDVRHYLAHAIVDGSFAEHQEGIERDWRLIHDEPYTIRVVPQSPTSATIFLVPDAPRRDGRRMQYVGNIDSKGRISGFNRAVGVPQPNPMSDRAQLAPTVMNGHDPNQPRFALSDEQTKARIAKLVGTGEINEKLVPNDPELRIPPDAFSRLQSFYVYADSDSTARVFLRFHGAKGMAERIEYVIYIDSKGGVGGVFFQGLPQP